MRISDWSSDVCSSDLYVAGQLAARLGVTVRLQDNPAGGLIATIVVPPTLLEVPADEASPTPTNTRPPAAPDPAPPTVAEPPADEPALPARHGVVPAAPASSPAPASLSAALAARPLALVDPRRDTPLPMHGAAAEPPPPDEPTTPHGRPHE